MRKALVMPRFAKTLLLALVSILFFSGQFASVAASPKDVAPPRPNPSAGSPPMCGGVGGLRCPGGMVCRMPGNPYPDQMGTCVFPQRACPRIYRPVCGVNRQTYPNSCEADRAGVRVAHQGACRRGPAAGTEGAPCLGFAGRQCNPGLYCYLPPEDLNVDDAQGVCRVRPTACTREYRPVCGANGQTYGNACGAAAAGVNVAYEGQCRNRPPPGPRPRPDRPEVCPNEYKPVCGTDGATYPNSCSAAQAGATIRYPGQCRR